MWRSKRFIITVLAAIVLAGSIGGIALAANDGDDSQPEARCGALIDKVCGIYNANPNRTGDIDCDILKDSINQARVQIRDGAMQSRLAKMIENGVIDETQAGEIQQWLEAKPESLDSVPMMFSIRGRGGFSGIRGIHGMCRPVGLPALTE